MDKKKIFSEIFCLLVESCRKQNKHYWYFGKDYLRMFQAIVSICFSSIFPAKLLFDISCLCFYCLCVFSQFKTLMTILIKSLLSKFLLWTPAALPRTVNSQPVSVKRLLIYKSTLGRLMQHCANIMGCKIWQTSDIHPSYS